MASLKLFTDGGSRGNPGHAAYGFVVFKLSETSALSDKVILDSGLLDSTSAQSGAVIVLEKCGNYLGITTNNQAEYEGLIAGLKWISANEPGGKVDVCMDSLLVVNQVKGLYKVNNSALLPKNQEARGLMAKLPGSTISYVPRAQNSVADSMVNLALDSHQN